MIVVDRNITSSINGQKMSVWWSWWRASTTAFWCCYATRPYSHVIRNHKFVCRDQFQSVFVFYLFLLLSYMYTRAFCEVEGKKNHGKNTLMKFHIESGQIKFIIFEVYSISRNATLLILSEVFISCVRTYEVKIIQFRLPSLENWKTFWLPSSRCFSKIRLRSSHSHVIIEHNM